MKILQVIHDFLLSCRAGSEFYTYYLSKELLKKHDVCLFFTIPENGVKRELVEGNFDGIPYMALRKNHVPYFHHPYQDRSRWVEKEVNRVITKFKPDIIHFQHLFNLSLNLPSLAKKKAIPSCFTLHDLWFLCPRIIFLTPDLDICDNPSPGNCLNCLRSEIKDNTARDEARGLQSILRRELSSLITFKKKMDSFFSYAFWRNYWIGKVFKDVDLFIAPSHFLQEKYMQSGILKEKIVFIRHGFNKSIFYGIKRMESAKMRFGFVGTISAHKGIYLLIDAFNKVQGSAELKIYGRIPMQMIDELKKRIANPAIHLMGELKDEDKGKAFSEIDVLVVPSICYENCPLTINEAFLAKIPVITTGIGGMAELVKDGENGFTFPVGNTEKLREKIELFINNPELRNKLSSNMPEIKDVETNAEEILHLYYQLIERKSH